MPAPVYPSVASSLNQALTLSFRRAPYYYVIESACRPHMSTGALCRRQLR